MIEWLRVEGVRNLGSQSVELGAPLVLVHGCNAQGKSSLLEAAYLAATTKSFRTRDAREAIAHEQVLASVGIRLRSSEQGQETLTLSIARERGEKRLRVGEYAAKLRHYLGFLPALALAADSLPSLAGSPSERRRFVDRATAAARPEHLQELAEYRRALAQRNRLLRDGAADAALEPWDALLARAGDSLARRRETHVAAWQEHMASWPELFPEGAHSLLRYRRTTDGPLHERLIASRREDRRAGMTLHGPHRDDLEIDTDNRNLLRFGSAGQVRSALAAITMAQARHVRAERDGRMPLLVLDDVDTELDITRLTALLTGAAREAQVLAATSKPEIARHVEARLLRVSAGRISDGV